jgi:hypothetical protein
MHDPIVNTLFQLDVLLGQIHLLGSENILASVALVSMFGAVIGLCAYACDRLQNPR